MNFKDKQMNNVSYPLQYFYFSLGIDSNDNEWLGAWWVGYLIGTVGFLLVAIPMFGFPKYLPSKSVKHALLYSFLGFFTFVICTVKFTVVTMSSESTRTTPLYLYIATVLRN